MRVEEGKTKTNRSGRGARPAFLPFWLVVRPRQPAGSLRFGPPETKHFSLNRRSRLEERGIERYTTRYYGVPVAFDASLEKKKLPNQKQKKRRREKNETKEFFSSAR